MAYDQIAEYVKMCLRNGYSKESIRQALAAKGHNPAIVDQIASQMNSNRIVANTVKVNSGSGKPGQNPLIYKRTIIDKIQDNLLVLELVALLVLVLAGVYLYYGDQIIPYLLLQFQLLVNP